IESRRNEGVALRELGRDKDSEEVLASANQLARSSGLARPVIEARLYRSTGVTAAAAGNSSLALTSLVNSTTAFTRALPESKPLADTYLLRAGELARAGRMATALPFCRTAVTSLVALKAGSNAILISPCLDIYADAAARQTADSQTLLAEMFSAAQLMQGGITSQQIAQATARLQENARDPKVATAIRNRQDAASNLEVLYRQRDELLAARANPGAAAATVQQVAPVPGAAADIDKQIVAAQRALADADSALQAAAPNFGQLVQQVVPASAVLAALHPNEAFVSIALGSKNGWVFLLRGHTISIARIDGGMPRMAKLVKEIRAGTELTTAGLPSFNTAAAQELYQATLGGLGTGLDVITALTIAPTGALLSLPFEVLLTGPAQADHLADAPWLLRKFAISHVPAPSNFVSLRKIAGGSRATQPWFGFGDFQPVTLAQAKATFPGPNCAESARLLATGLLPLPGARKELEAARLLLGASASDELLGRAFTAPAVMKASLKDFRILHFATHALLPSELACQSEPAIIASTPVGAKTANDALLTATDVVSMDLDADLIILSACNSGGPEGGTAGESLSGLARAFFYAGARALLVTHWDVNDQVAAYLVADTLRRIRETPG
ncbi:MAG: CHAT domain-containing protein, partial [Acetobacteraceae bacterium]